MEEDQVTIVALVNEPKGLNVTFSSGWTAEDLCIKVCKQLGIGPVARHLFALRNFSTRFWYAPNNELECKDKVKYEFRLRFKPNSLKKLKEIDEKAYDYYFHQVRVDVLENKVPDIVFERHKADLLGLGVCDMYRVMLEKDVPREVVQSNYKKYIPKECIKKHSFFLKKPVQRALSKLSGHTASFVREQYLNQFATMAPNYLYEDYKVIMINGQSIPPTRILLRVDNAEVKYLENEEGTWKTFCAIRDLSCVCVREDIYARIYTNEGITLEAHFPSKAVCIGFMSAVDGYYRLSFNWTFNPCVGIVTPSLEKLKKLKCHGPVGGLFSYEKLHQKRSNRHGTFILRESELKYQVFYLDCCKRDGRRETFKIEQLGVEEFVLSDSVQVYKSIDQLISAHSDPEGRPYLAECLLPSGREESPLLLCAPDKAKRKNDVAADEDMISDLLHRELRVIFPGSLQVFKSKPFPKNSDNGRVGNSATTVYKAIWRPQEGYKATVALKLLNDEKRSLYGEYLQFAEKWGQLRSGSLVRLFGLIVNPTAGVLMEMVKYGPLDVYLRTTPRQLVKIVDLVEATAYLARAMYYLNKRNIVHANIRCRKLFLHAHTGDSFIVKLTDPGIFSYTDDDIHWLPPECYTNYDSARQSTRADVWAFATTVWQIFARGTVLPHFRNAETLKGHYLSGKRLPMPRECPPDVYKLMTQSWGEPGGEYRKPGEIVTDMNMVIDRVYSSRRKHTYARILPKFFKDKNKTDDEDTEPLENENSSSDGESRANSIFTDKTSLPWDDGDETGKLLRFSENDQESLDDRELSARLGWLTQTVGTGDGSFIDSDLTRDGIDSDGSHGHMDSILELDSECQVILQGKIGQGFYGEVYRGTLERDNNEDSEPQQVAVKKLKTRTVEADIIDFEREIGIMKTLKHPNIVQILGVISEPEICLVMEYVKHGSLQSYLEVHREGLGHKRLLGFALDIATGMEYLGKKSIVHRDLACRNILVADKNMVKISDFGLARVMEKNNYYILQTNRDMPIKWYAPESLTDGKFSPKSDVWSFGVTMYETFSFGKDPQLPGLRNGRESGELIAKLLEALGKGVRLPRPRNCPQTVYVKLMYSCWHIDSHQRPNFATLCNDIKDLMEQY